VIRAIADDQATGREWDIDEYSDSRI